MIDRECNKISEGSRLYFSDFYENKTAKAVNLFKFIPVNVLEICGSVFGFLPSFGM